MNTIANSILNLVPAQYRVLAQNMNHDDLQVFVNAMQQAQQIQRIQNQFQLPPNMRVIGHFGDSQLHFEIDPIYTISEARIGAMSLIPQLIFKYTTCKIKMIQVYELTEGTNTRDSFYLHSNFVSVYEGLNHRTIFNNLLKTSDWNHNQLANSRFIIGNLVKVIFKVGSFNGYLGSCYQVELPEWLQKKKCVRNIRNSDSKCFLWCLISYLLNDDRNRKFQVTKYYHTLANRFNLEGVNFPTSARDIDVFENQNPYAINVHGLNNVDQSIYPIRQSAKRNGDPLINLLYIAPEDINNSNNSNNSNNNLPGHYCLITSLAPLASSINHRVRYICNYCFNKFHAKEKYDSHMENCQNNKPGTTIQKITYPSEKSCIYKFNDYTNCDYVDYVIYADIECIITEDDGRNIPSGFGFKVVSNDPDAFDENITGNYCMEFGYGCVERAIRRITEIRSVIKRKYEKVKKIVRNKSNKDEYHCLIPNQKCCYCLSTNTITRWYNKLTGKINYDRYVCNVCNKKRNNEKNLIIPVLFHNLKGYDSHLIIQALGNSNIVENFDDINAIPQSSEKFISFSLYSSYPIRFIDSYAFLNTGLERLASFLQQSDFKYCTDVNMRRKGYYPYEYMNSFTRFHETELPPIEAFYSKLRNENIDAEQYKIAQRMWKYFQCNDLRDYHDLYLRSDILLLADVFENFRKLCMEDYNLDPCHYYTAPGLANSAMLKRTNIYMELLSDQKQEMFNMIESGIRGGMSTITQRYAKANNKDLDNYNPKQKESWIRYYDANNLYGWAMSQKLPYGYFEFCTYQDYLNETWEEYDMKPDDKYGNWGVDVNFVNKHLNKDDNNENNIPITTDDICKWSHGYILEVDLIYPQDIHNKHNSFPLAPERMLVESNMLSKFNKQYNNKIFNEKLIASLYPRKKYIIHYKNLQLYLRLGMVLTKVYRVLRFRESRWMKIYIAYNSLQRRNHNQNAFKKNFYKLMSNSAFGKTMENLRNRSSIKIAGNEDIVQKFFKKDTCKDVILVGSNLAMMYMKKESICLNKPIYNGFSILELSKTLMYRFHYDVVKKSYGSNARLLFTDTDSLCYQFFDKDPEEWMQEHINEFDVSSYKSDIFDKDDKNKNAFVIGKMKNEESNSQITQFCGLRSKCYMYTTENDSTIMKSKGIPTQCFKEFEMKGFKAAMKKKSCKDEIKYMAIVSKKHQLVHKEMKKKCLSGYDDKRFVLSNCIDTLAYGHKYILSGKYK